MRNKHFDVMKKLKPKWDHDDVCKMLVDWFKREGYISESIIKYAPMIEKMGHLAPDVDVAAKRINEDELIVCEVISPKNISPCRSSDPEIYRGIGKIIFLHFRYHIDKVYLVLPQWGYTLLQNVYFFLEFLCKDTDFPMGLIFWEEKGEKLEFEEKVCAKRSIFCGKFKDVESAALGKDMKKRISEILEKT